MKKVDVFTLRAQLYDALYMTVFLSKTDFEWSWYFLPILQLTRRMRKHE